MTMCEHRKLKRWATSTNEQGASFTVPVLYCSTCIRAWTGGHKVGIAEVTLYELDMTIWLLCGAPDYAAARVEQAMCGRCEERPAQTATGGLLIGLCEQCEQLLRNAVQP